MKAWILGGTSEGIELLKASFPCVYTSATEYGAKLAGEAGAQEALCARMDLDQMCAFLVRGDIACVLDATHPYALEATRNAAEAARCMGIPYMRVLRESVKAPRSAVTAGSAGEAAQYLAATEGNILLTTGSKDLDAFAIPALLPRLFVRVLPTQDSIARCEALGLAPKQIIAMQGPFGAELNEALMRELDVAFLVTKDGGKEGGVTEKYEAAERTGVQIVMIARRAEEGETVEHAAQWAKSLLFDETPRFPLWLDARGKLAVVAGGGKVAARRVETLLRCGMCVRVICPEEFGREGVEHIKRVYRDGDARGAFIVVAATNERETNARIAAEAKRCGAWVSVADDARAGSFHFPALLSDGVVAASVHSGTPALTKSYMDKLRGAWEIGISIEKQ